MKTFAQIRESTEQLREPITQINELVSNMDMPTVLVLRRKAIRLFPGNQRVAQYVNDNLDLEIAIPYNPDTLGKKKIVTSVANESVYWPDLKPNEMIWQLDEYFEPGTEVKVHRMYGMLLKQPIRAVIHRHIGNGMYHIRTNQDAATVVHDMKWGKGWHNTHEHNIVSESFENVPKEHKIEVLRAKYARLAAHEPDSELDEALWNWLSSEVNENGEFGDMDDDILNDVYEDFMALMGVNEETSDNLFGMYLKHHDAPISFHDRKFKPLKHIEAAVAKRYGHPALSHFRAAAAHMRAGDHDKANHHYAKYKAAAAQLGEETLTELSKKTLGRYIRKSAEDASYRANAQGFKAGRRNPVHNDEDEPTAKEAKRHRGIAMATAKLTREETITESAHDALHTINKRKTPAIVRFRNGANQMVHHATAAQVMKLHSIMNAANKRKIENLVNSSPDGLKKVHDFALAHMRG